MPRTTPRPPTCTSCTPLGLVAALTLFAATGCGDDSAANDGDDIGDGTASDTDDPSAGSVDDSGDSGVDDSSGDDAGEGGVEIEPAPGGIRRMVRREFIATIDMLLGAEAAAAASPPVDTPQEGFDAVGAAVLALDSVAVEQYETTAAAIADATLANPARLAQTAPCVTASPGPACYTEVARDFGRLAFRRPLEDVEIELLSDVGVHGQDWGEGDFETGLRYELMAILQMPSFLYLVQLGEPDEASGYRRLDPYELATRMSIFLLGRGPDGAMLDLAEAGGLDDAAAIRETAQAMLATPQARAALAGFFDEYLRLDELETTAKNAELFPDFNQSLARSMRQETLLLVHDIVWQQDGDYRELFTADYTYIDDELATLYGVAAPDQAGIFERRDWPADQSRAGYLSQASFLTKQSSSLRNSPTRRGRFVQQSVLCTDIPPPPVGTVTTLPTLPDDATLRDQLLLHMEVESCATCHAPMDPIGFAFENFDAIGAYRLTEPNGTPVSSQGEIPGYGEWQNAQQLADIIAADPRMSVCFVNNLIRGELGHRETPGEADAIAELDARFGDAGFSVQTLLTEFPNSPLFQLVDEPK